MLAASAVHLVGQEGLREVCVDAEALAPACDAVEAVGVLSDEMDGHDVAAGLHALGDEGLLPGDVMDFTVDEP